MPGRRREDAGTTLPFSSAHSDLDSPSVEAAFFDLDKTVIAKASIAAFGRPFYRGGLISRRTVVRALASQFVYMHLGASETKLERVRELVLGLTRGWDRDEVARIVRETLEEIVEPIVYEEAEDLIAGHRASGRRVYLVSASPEEIVGPLAEFLHVDGAIASRATLDADGRYTGEMELYAYGPWKAEAVVDLAAREGIDLARSYAYSDSFTDVPLLECVGHPVAVNPDRLLAKVARDREWEVLSFVKPVRLRDSVPVPTLPQAALLSATAVAITGVAAVAWRYSQRLREHGITAL